MELGKEVRAGEVHVRITGISTVPKAMRLDETTNGVGVYRKDQGRSPRPAPCQKRIHRYEGLAKETEEEE